VRWDVGPPYLCPYYGVMRRKTSVTHPLRVDFLRDLPCEGDLGLIFAPGKKGPSLHGGHWDRDLDADLEKLLHEDHADVLVSLLDSHEFDALGIPMFLERARAAGLRVVHFPIRDVDVPPPTADGAYADLVSGVVAELSGGATVVVHCRGGRAARGWWLRVL
jgi:rhodanese-related sulfurtransferase